jgi:hypothetical protein
MERVFRSLQAPEKRKIRVEIQAALCGVRRGEG